MIIQIGARLGYAVRGLIFAIIGVLALLAAGGGQKQAVGTQGALELLLAQPFGRALLWLVAAGLFCFAIWRVIQAISILTIAAATEKEFYGGSRCLVAPSSILPFVSWLSA
jgi:hypothetical protein